MRTLVLAIVTILALGITVNTVQAQPTTWSHTVMADFQVDTEYPYGGEPMLVKRYATLDNQDEVHIYSPAKAQQSVIIHPFRHFTNEYFSYSDITHLRGSINGDEITGAEVRLGTLYQNDKTAKWHVKVDEVIPMNQSGDVYTFDLETNGKAWIIYYKLSGMSQVSGIEVDHGPLDYPATYYYEQSGTRHLFFGGNYLSFGTDEYRYIEPRNETDSTYSEPGTAIKLSLAQYVQVWSEFSTNPSRRDEKAKDVNFNLARLPIHLRVTPFFDNGSPDYRTITGVKKVEGAGWFQFNPETSVLTLRDVPIVDGRTQPLVVWATLSDYTGTPQGKGKVIGHVLKHAVRCYGGESLIRWARDDRVNDETRFCFTTLPKVDSQNPPTYSGVVSSVVSDTETPNEFALNQNYPNPFNPTTTIFYSIPESDNVNLTIYNVRGEQIATLVDEFQNSGQYSITFDGVDLPSGIYLYQLTTGSHTSIKRMSLLK